MRQERAHLLKEVRDTFYIGSINDALHVERYGPGSKKFQALQGPFKSILAAQHLVALFRPSIETDRCVEYDSTLFGAMKQHSELFGKKQAVGFNSDIDIGFDQPLQNF